MALEVPERAEHRPNKVEQARHVKFLRGYPGGLEGLMAAHAALIEPKFRAVNEVLSEELGADSAFATWKNPRGGYFISLDTAEPVADRVVALADAVGVSLTPAGATYPAGRTRTTATSASRRPARRSRRSTWRCAPWPPACVWRPRSTARATDANAGPACA